MGQFADKLHEILEHPELKKQIVIASVLQSSEAAGYTIVDIDKTRPWGGFVRFSTEDGDAFVSEFFPDVNPTDARLGNPEAELSPKILIVEAGQRLSWQMHRRRAERWVFLNDGAYYKSNDADHPGDPIYAKAGDVIQFEAGECHRLMGQERGYTLVAEIWQHTDSNQLSDEADIVRLQDDYKR